MFGLFKGRRRRRLAAEPFPPAWRGILREHVHLYRRMPPEDRDELERHVRVFLDEKEFEGCGGMEIDDGVRVIIAGHACVLLLHLETDYFPGLRTILVYPEPFLADDPEVIGPGIVIEGGEEVRLGESWDRGHVVLAWEEVALAARRSRDGHNVVLHEFAHQLDTEDGGTDGAPLLEEPGQASRWAAVMGEAYAELREAVARRRHTLLDQYGATNPAEFFAVVTEFFFEKPTRLAREHPDLYAALADYYHQDPAQWSVSGSP